ncbi:isochorismatase family protein [Thermobifida halotolerans]|uniref:Isochorismatase family protein n=2 Tax=Thermobifida halotolerans TaxID=483545 RepID=A0AA97M1L5_9ACTN|nr:isochorismatase family protein [Thermobifida halotolerans]
MPRKTPPNRVDWRPERHRCALLVHDMQRYFLAAFRRDAEPVPALLRNVRALRDRCAALDIPRIYTVQPGDQKPRQRGLLREFWGEGLRDDEAHTVVVPEVAPHAGDGDITVTKWRYSAFARTGLEELLRGLGRDQLVVCGVYAHIGVLMTACDAFMRDVEPFVVADAVADFSAEEHAMALDYAARRCAAVTTTRTVLGALDGVAAEDGPAPAGGR